MFRRILVEYGLLAATNSRVRKHAGVFVLLLSFGPHVVADEGDGFSGQISLQHNYQFQGTTYNLSRLTPQLGVRFGQGRWSVGAWAGEIRYPGHDKETLEYDVFVGYQQPVGLDQGVSVSVWLGRAAARRSGRSDMLLAARPT
ncbi:MAG: hypothetical protein AAF525_15390, partial [Pseudomonadota bacterium]